MGRSPHEPSGRAHARPRVDSAKCGTGIATEQEAPDFASLIRATCWTWKYICGEIGGASPILVTGAILGRHKLTKPQAAAAATLFGL